MRNVSIAAFANAVGYPASFISFGVYHVRQFQELQPLFEGLVKRYDVCNEVTIQEEALQTFIVYFREKRREQLWGWVTVNGVHVHRDPRRALVVARVDKNAGKLLEAALSARVHAVITAEDLVALCDFFVLSHHHGAEKAVALD